MSVEENDPRHESLYERGGTLEQRLSSCNNLSIISTASPSHTSFWLAKAGENFVSYSGLARLLVEVEVHG